MNEKLGVILKSYQNKTLVIFSYSFGKILVRKKYGNNFFPGAVIRFENLKKQRNGYFSERLILESFCSNISHQELSWLHSLIKICLKNLQFEDPCKKSFFILKNSISLFGKKYKKEKVEALKYCSMISLFKAFGFLSFKSILDEIKEEPLFLEKEKFIFLEEEKLKINIFLEKLEKNISKIKTIFINSIKTA